MDFQYHYTPHQERFRAEVARWLDANIPPAMDPVVCRHPSEDDWPALMRLRLLLGQKGWLAPQEPVSRGGSGATQGEEVVLAEELAVRGLAWLQDAGAAALRQAFDARATQAQADEFLGPVSRGELAIWHTRLNPDDVPDPSDIGVVAAEDGDDYVLNGLDQFTGIAPRPDLLWALVKLCDGPVEEREERTDSDLTFSCLVPADLEGISYLESRQLTPCAPRFVSFEGVRVPRYYLLGLPGEGALLMQTAAAGATENPAPNAADPETDDLQQRLLDLAIQSVNDPDRQEVLLQMVMDAYIDRRVSRLFRTRDAYIGQHAGNITYHRAQTKMFEARAAKRLSEVAGQVMGPFSLLDREDPRAPAHGSFEAQQRESLARNSANDHWLMDRNTIARCLGLLRADYSGSGKPG